MEELKKAKHLYEVLLKRVEDDMDTAEKYKKDMMFRYNPNATVDCMVTIQSQVLRIQDYITQKHSNYVELLRQYDDICKAIREAKAEA